MLSRKVLRPLALCGLCVETDLYGIVKQHNENTKEIQRLQRMNTELSKLFSTNLTALSEARTLLSSLPESLPATIDSNNPSCRPPPAIVPCSAQCVDRRQNPVSGDSRVCQ